MNVFDRSGKPVKLGACVGSGGEASVYLALDRPGSLAKIYTLGSRPEYMAKLAWMAANPPEDPTRAHDHASLAWPAGLLYDSKRRLAGYLMPHIQSAVPALDVFNPRRRRLVLPLFDRRYLHRVARNLAVAIRALHTHGYIVGDLNESNIMVTPSALVTIIDTDSFQVQAHSRGATAVYYCPVAKPEYTPPELQGKPTAKLLRRPEQDNFGLGVLIFQLLMEGSHPFRAQWLAGGEPPSVDVRIARGLFPYTATPLGPVAPPIGAPGLNLLHPDLAELMRRCFVDGQREPELRPGPEVWASALAQAEKALIACMRGHIYSNHLRACPVCGLPQPAAGLGLTRPAPAAEAAAPAFAPRKPGASSVTAAGSAQVQEKSKAGAPAAAPSRPASSTGTGSLAAGWPASRPAQTAPTAAKPAPGRPAGAAANAATASTAAKVPNSASARPTPSAAAAAPPPGVTQPARVRTHPPVSAATVAVAGPASAVWPGLWTWSLPALKAPAWLQKWLHTRLARSLFTGGLLGALIGAPPGVFLATAGGSLGMTAAWSLLWLSGGLAAGLLRGWNPSFRLGHWIERTLGWRLFWQGAGLLLGGLAGGIAGFFVGPVLIFPALIGLASGARLGMAAGKRVWQAGARYGWERIWTLAGTGSAALMGALCAWVLAVGPPGALGSQLASTLAGWMVDQQASLPLVWAATGALGGAFGGWGAGFVIDLAARFLHLLD